MLVAAELHDRESDSYMVISERDMKTVQSTSVMGYDVKMSMYCSCPSSALRRS
jgi:hypothetical protein